MIILTRFVKYQQVAPLSSYLFIHYVIAPEERRATKKAKPVTSQSVMVCV